MPHTWSHITIKIDYGYFASFGSVTITCYNDGHLWFEGEPQRLRIEERRITDKEHFISKASLKKIDGIAKAIFDITELKPNMLMDGPSFDCTVHFNSGIIKGFGYVSAGLHPEHGGNLEKSIRKILREPFFLKKYEKELSGFG